ncbi:hypothetical protein TNCV_437931 [Trichonephila clavipes]|nr:hypothetical protein TNCV_437931 [Trichonephila clavipes]
MSSNTRCSGLSNSEGIQRLVWPARSPDLNPLKMCGMLWGRQVAGRNYPPTNKNTLIRALTEEWDKLPQRLLDNVVQKSSTFPEAGIYFSSTPCRRIPITAGNFGSQFPHSRLKKHLLRLSVNQNLITLVPFWIAETGHLWFRTLNCYDGQKLAIRDCGKKLAKLCDFIPKYDASFDLQNITEITKSLVYADKPQTLDHLEDNIRRVIADIRPQMLEKVIENWTSRLDYIRASRGSPMPEIILKM